MQKYDLIIVLGSKPDTATWQFPSHVLQSLDVAAELLQNEAAPYIALSGKWALSFDRQGITQPFLECDAMAKYLVGKGVMREKLLTENESKDTIANLYFLKRNILQPRSMKHVLLITADFRVARIEYLTQKVFGPEYEITFQSVLSILAEQYPHEADTMARTQKFLQDMAPGDDHFLDGKFYSDPFYI